MAEPAPNWVDRLAEMNMTPAYTPRLEALEEIRQRVADGWCVWPTADVKGQGAWRCIYSERDDKDIKPEVAAVLWPST